MKNLINRAISILDCCWQEYRARRCKHDWKTKDWTQEIGITYSRCTRCDAVSLKVTDHDKASAMWHRVHIADHTGKERA